MSIQSIPERGSKSAFTLLELILVLGIMAMVAGIAVPFFSKTFSDMQMKASVKLVSRMTKYARTMAILRQEKLSVAINIETREIYLGAAAANSTTNDGELDQEVFKRLGYVDEEDEAPIEKEQHRYFPEGVTINDIELTDNKDSTDSNLYVIDYYPNGQSDWFKVDIEDSRGLKVTIENDPISGKLTTESE